MTSLLTIIGIIILDQGSKKWFLDTIGMKGQRSWLGGKVKLQYLLNRGAFLGFLKESQKALLIINSMAILLLMFLVISTKSSLAKHGLAMMLGGAMGNHIDRFAKKGVVDFITLPPKHEVHYNLADFAVFAGALIVGVGHLIRKN